MNSPFILLFDFELDRDSMEPLQFNQFSIQVQFACEYVNWAASLLIWEWIEMRRKQNWIKLRFMFVGTVQLPSNTSWCNSLTSSEIEYAAHTLNHSHKCMVYYVKNQCETGIGHWHSNRNEFKRLQTLARTYNELNLNEPQSIEPATSNVVVVHLHFICIWHNRPRSLRRFSQKKHILL